MELEPVNEKICICICEQQRRRDRGGFYFLPTEKYNCSSLYVRNFENLTGSKAKQAGLCLTL